MIKIISFHKSLSIFLTLSSATIFGQNSLLLDVKKNAAISSTETFQAINNGNLTINPGARIIIFKNALLTVENKITNKGDGENFIIESDGNLIQTNGTVNNNIGSVKARRQVIDVKNSFDTNKHMDYIYWSSPVAAQGLRNFSPGTPYNRIYKYNETNDYFNPVNLTAEPTFIAAKGYAFRAEDGQIYSYTKTYDFKGVPNNGDYSIPIQRSPDQGLVQHGYNMVGNPYPSNMSFDALYAFNNDTVFKTAWFWVNDNFTYYQSGNGYVGNGYAVYNGTGGNNGTDNGTDNNPDRIKAPNGIIKVGQGFIIQMKHQLPGNTLSTAVLNFNNGMRVKDAGQFYSKNADQKDRYWIKLVSPTAITNTILVGYVPGSTTDFEQDFDAESFGLSSDLLYSNLESRRLVIQGRGQFSNDDQVEIGANFFASGAYTISLMTAEGVFANGQSIYLKDKQKGVITKLSEGSYTFEATKGEVNGRFEIIYQPETVLATDTKTKEGLVVYRDGDHFKVQAKNHKITKLDVFDSSGRLVYSLAPNSLQVIIPADKLINGLYLLKIDQGGVITSKKILK